MPSTTSVARPEELLTLLPYVLGYHPEDSIVLLGLVDRRRLGPIQRLDALSPADVYPRELLARLSRPLVEDGAWAVLLAAFVGAAGSGARGLAEVSAALAADGIEVVDALVVQDRSWWSLHCQDRACCPAGGRPLPDPQDVPAVAEFVLRGVSPLPNRAALAERLAGPKGQRWEPVGPVAGAVSVAEALHAWVQILGSDVEPGEAGLSLAVAAAADPILRDEVLSMLCPGLMSDDGPRARHWEADQMPHVLDRMSTIGSRLPDDQRRHVLAMTGAVAWWHGYGTMARLCVEHARDIDPSHSLARLLSHMLDLGMRPGGCR